MLAEDKPPILVREGGQVETSPIPLPGTGLPTLSGGRGGATVCGVGTGVRVKPLPAPFILLLVYRVHDPTGILPAAGSAVQVRWHLALGADFGSGFCRVHKGVGFVYSCIYIYDTTNYHSIGYLSPFR